MGGKVEEVKHDVAQDKDTADGHEPRGELGLHAGLEGVGGTARRAVLFHQDERGDDVEHHGAQQAQAHPPDEPVGQVPEVRAIFIDDLGSREELKIPNEVDDDEANEQDAGNGDHPFLPDR